MDKKDKQKRIKKIKGDLENKLESLKLNQKTSDDSLRNKELHKQVKNHDINYSREATTNNIRKDDNLSITKKRKNTPKKIKTKSKLQIPILIIIGLLLVLLAYVYKMNEDLKKKIAIEEQLEKEAVDYKVKDTRFKDVEEDFSDDELQNIE